MKAKTTTMEDSLKIKELKKLIHSGVPHGEMFMYMACLIDPVSVQKFLDKIS